jgi:hypothetical protein
LSETVGAENLALADDPVQAESSNTDPEEIDEWVRPLYNLVISNSEEVRPWSWMGGTEIRLGTAIWSYPNVSPETVFSAIADISEQLAKRENETDEDTEAEEEEPETKEEKKEEKKESQKETDKPNVKNTEHKQEKKVAPVKAPEVLTRVDKTKAEAVQKAAAPVQAKPAPTQIQPSAPDKTAPQAETARIAEPRTEAIAGQPPAEAAAVLESAPEPSLKIEPRIAPAAPTIEAAPASNAEVGLVTAELPQPVPDEAIYQQTQTVAAESAPDFEAEEISAFETEDLLIDSHEEITQELIESFEIGPPQEAVPYQITAEGLDEEVLFALPADIEPAPIAVYEAAATDLSAIEAVEAPDDLVDEEILIFKSEIEPVLNLPAAPTIYEQPARVEPIVETIEEAVVELAETLEASEPQMVEVAKQILDKIIAVPAKLEAGIDMTEEEAQTELEELFVELFERIGIDYTPELIESLARLTLAWQLTAETENLKIEEEQGELPQDTGTHEIIKKLLACLKSIQKAITHAGAIGKSALRLYSFSLGTA